MSTFIEAISKLEGKFVEVGTQGEWADKGQLRSIGQDHIVLVQPNSERMIVVRMGSLEYVKEIPAPAPVRSR
jgi:hypothetical protein